MRNKKHSAFGKYVRYMAGGATPKKEGGEEYYAEIGVPFLRVQNILPEGLSLEDVVFINEQTNTGLLKRSQVAEDDLLVTITGRIASSCVAPKEFTGNINQHSVVIKTDSLNESEYLASYLNSDVGQKLALRRTTGGTRPALDYPALKSIPVIYDPRIVPVMRTAYEAKLSKQAEAKNKMASIDGMVLDTLGIKLPEKDDGTLKNRIFCTKSGAVTAGRIDPHFSSPYFTRFDEAVRSYPFPRLSEVAKFSNEVWDQESIFGDTFPYIEIGEIDIAMGEINETTNLVKAEAPSRAKMIAKPNDILISTTRPNRGATALLDDEFDCRIASTGFAIIRTVAAEVSRKYIYHVLRHRICLTQMDHRSSGGNYPAITLEELAKVKIPIPPPEVQAEIADKVDAIYAEAKQLRREGDEILANAKAEVEKMILG